MIVHLTSEISPYYKRGGLGDVAGALPFYLSQKHKNVVVAFYYEGMMNEMALKCEGSFYIHVQHIQYEFIYYHHLHHEVDVYFLNMADSCMFSEMETGVGHRHAEEGERPYRQVTSYVIYLYFAQAALQLIKQLDLQPAFLIFHDWHVCGCFAFRELLQSIRLTCRCTTILLIHNFEHQGEIFPDAIHLVDDAVAEELLPVFLRFGTASLLSLGLKNADYVATVSNSYALELMQGTLPHPGLRYLSAMKRRTIISLPNGVDARKWNPASSPYILQPYDKFTAVAAKRVAKKELTRQLGLTDPDKPLFLLMARLTEQKGISLLLNLWNDDAPVLRQMEALLDTGINLVVCGRPSGGETGKIHTLLSGARQTTGHRFAYLPDYTDQLAHQLLAASDAMLCPSLFEPCGLVHLYGMAFGTVPVVRPVGGLKDTVVSAREDPSGYTGFYIEQFTHNSLCAAICQAVNMYHSKPDEWQQLLRRCMEVDYSWNSNIHHYFRLFEEIGQSATSAEAVPL